MRHARSYSILDHELLHGGYLARLSHQALALYLFLCVVGDRDGRSYYGDASICRTLHFSRQTLITARSDLIACDLIEYRKLYYWIKDLTRSLAVKRKAKMPPEPHSPNRVLFAQSERGFHPVRDIVPEGLKVLLKTLDEGKR